MRAASLARYLPAEDIRLDVLTTRNPAVVGNDPTLLKDIPPSVTIHRTLTLDLPFGMKKAIKRFLMGAKSSKKPATGQQTAPKANKKPGLLKRIVDNLLLPDPQVTWFPVLSRVAPRIIRERKIDLVLITVPTFSNLLLIKKLRKQFPHLPIVADFRDEWITTSFELVSFSFSDSPRAQQVARRIEADTIANSTAIVTVTDAARRRVQSRYPGVPDSKFHLVPNGFDATKMTRSVPVARNDGKVLLTHVGSIYPSTAPSSLVDAINLLPPDVKSRLKLRFIGHIEEPRFKEALLGLGDMVELYGYLPQREALAAMNETDYLLLLNHDPLNVGNKFYDYVGGGKPILGAVHPEGETRRLLEQMRAGWWAGIDDVEGIRKLLLDAVNRGTTLLQDFHPDTHRIAQYERAVLAHRYARLLHKIAGRQQQGSDETSPTLVQDLQEC